MTVGGCPRHRASLTTPRRGIPARRARERRGYRILHRLARGGASGGGGGDAWRGCARSEGTGAGLDRASGVMRAARSRRWEGATFCNGRGSLVRSSEGVVSGGRGEDGAKEASSLSRGRELNRHERSLDAVRPGPRSATPPARKTRRIEDMHSSHPSRVPRPPAMQRSFHNLCIIRDGH